MHRSRFFAGPIRFAFAVSCAYGQAGAAAPNPVANPRPSPGVRLVLDDAASLGSPAPAGTSGANTVPAAPNVSDVSDGNGQPICGIAHLARCIQDLGQDDKGIFTSPLRIQPNDAYWLAPLGAATGLAFAYDADAAQAAGVDRNRTNTANTVANFGSFFATGAEGAGIYFIGLAQKNPKLAETGRLGAEAVIDSGTVTLVTKLVTC